MIQSFFSWSFFLKKNRSILIEIFVLNILVNGQINYIFYKQKKYQHYVYAISLKRRSLRRKTRLLRNIHCVTCDPSFFFPVPPNPFSSLINQPCEFSVKKNADEASLTGNKFLSTEKLPIRRHRRNQSIRIMRQLRYFHTT